MKIFHEAPISLFKDVQKVTDGDYALCHLLEENEAYAKLFKQAAADGREIILDNSVFELNSSVNWSLLNNWAWILQPAFVVLPDVLDNGVETVKNARKFLYNNKLPPNTQTIAVVQGETVTQAAKCYRELAQIADVIAFSFNMAIWQTAETFQPIIDTIGRVTLLSDLEMMGVIDKQKKHHLLGCSLPVEFKFQQRPYIYSVDTSNPIMWAINHGKYPDLGPHHKPRGKLCDHIGYESTELLKETVMSNIEQFRRWCS